jgi:hypothetical protein
MFDRSAVVAVEIELGFFLDEYGHYLAFAVSLVVPQELLSVAQLFSCMDIVLSFWLFFVSGLGQRLRVIF